MVVNVEKELALFCKNITYLRALYGYSKTEMARLLGISRYTLSKLEQGIIPKKLNIDIFYNIYDVFHILPDRIICADIQAETLNVDKSGNS